MIPSRPPSCEDSLRALGRYLDFTGLAEISLVVSADEWALTARRGHDARQYPARIRFTVPEILALRNVTASQRGRGKPGRKRPTSRLRALEERGTSAAPLSAWLEQERALSYQELLRAIGRALDQRGVGSFELHETDTEVILHLAAAPRRPRNCTISTNKACVRTWMMPCGSGLSTSPNPRFHRARLPPQLPKHRGAQWQSDGYSG